MKKLKKLFNGNTLLLTSIVLLLLLIVFFGVSYVTETPATIKDLRITNISDTSVTVTYFTEVPTYGSVIVSDKNDFDFLNQLSRTRYYDDRNDGELRYSHHITVSGLKPSSAYFFEVMGNLKQVKYTYPVLETGKTLDTLVTPDPTYGSFSENTSMDSIVYLSIEGSTLQSTYLGAGNTFSMDKANIRTPDLEDQAKYKYHDPILIEILNNDTQLGYQTNVGSDQPTAKFETTTNKETSKIKLNTSVLGSVFAEAPCSAATLKEEEGSTCTGPNGYQYVVKDGQFSDEIARMQDYYVQTGITGSKDFTEQGKIDAAKGNNQGPFSPTNPAPIPVNAKLPLCSNDDKSVKVGDPCRGAQNGFTYKRTATGFDDTIAKAQNADKNLLFADPTVTKEQEAQTTAEKAKIEAEHKALCAQLTVNKVVWTKKNNNTLFNCKDGTYTEYPCAKGEVVIQNDDGKDDQCGIPNDKNMTCKSLSETEPDVKVGHIFKSGDVEYIVAGCENGKAIMYFYGASSTMEYIKQYGKEGCTKTLKKENNANKLILCDVYQYKNEKGSCTSERTVAEDCIEPIPIVAPIQPPTNIVPTGSVTPKTDGANAGVGGGGKPLLSPASGTVAGYYNLDYKDCATTAKTFDTTKVTKTCGCGLIPDTAQNGGNLTLNVSQGIVYTCEGREDGGGTIKQYDLLKNISTIPIGVINKTTGKLEVVPSEIPAGTQVASSTNLETKEVPAPPSNAILIKDDTYSKVCTSWNNDKSCCKEVTVTNIQTFSNHQPVYYPKAVITSSCSQTVLNPRIGDNCGQYQNGEPYCANNGKTEFGLGRCVNGIPQLQEGLCDPSKPNKPSKASINGVISPVNAEAVLGVSDSSGVELNSTGTYTITSGNTSIKEFKVMDLVNGKAKIVFFDDKNANGIRDTGEEDITTPVEVKIEKTSDISRFELNEGWNLVGYEYTEARTAKDLLSNISSKGGYATHVATYRQGGWVMYSERAEKSFGNNFNLIPGEGYFVKVIKSGKLSFEGNKIAANQPYRLSNGWNLLSFRLDPVLKASKLIDAINLNSPVASDVVTRYVSGKYENVVKDKDTVYGSDFDIEENKGYFVRVTKGGVVIMK